MRARPRAAVARHPFRNGVGRRFYARSLLARGKEFGKGNFGRPVQVADDGARERDQDQDFDQEDSRDRDPKVSAAYGTLGHR